MAINNIDIVEASDLLDRITPVLEGHSQWSVFHVCLTIGIHTAISNGVDLDRFVAYAAEQYNSIVNEIEQMEADNGNSTLQ